MSLNLRDKSSSNRRTFLKSSGAQPVSKQSLFFRFYERA